MANPTQQREDHWRGGLISVERVLAFSDALVGIVMTLLIVELVAHLDELVHTAPDQQAADGAVGTWAGEHIWFFPAHAAAFFVLTYLWRRHHEVFRHFDRLSRETAWLNAGFLLVICLMPLATSLIARSDFNPLALITFFGVVVLAMVFLLGILEHGHRVEALVGDSQTTIRVLRLFLTIPIVAAFVCLAIAVVLQFRGHSHSLWVFLLFCLLLFSTPWIINRALKDSQERQPPSSGLAEHFKTVSAKTREGAVSRLQYFFGRADPDRTLLFTDGVYAIALTLTAFQLVPDDDHLDHDEVRQALVDVFSFSFSDSMSFWFFATLFIVVQLLWFQHVRIFLFSGYIGGRTIWLNAIHLFVLVWFPVIFGLLTQAPSQAVSPWWAATIMLALASLTQGPVAWSALVYQKETNEEIKSNLRYVYTRMVLLVLGVGVMFAPLGMFRGGLLFLLMIDPLTNLLWHRKWSRHPLKLIMNDPANGLRGPIQIRGIIAVVIVMGLFVLDSWWLYDLWLFPR